MGRQSALGSLAARGLGTVEVVSGVRRVGHPQACAG